MAWPRNSRVLRNWLGALFRVIMFPFSKSPSTLAAFAINCDLGEMFTKQPFCEHDYISYSGVY